MTALSCKRCGAGAKELVLHPEDNSQECMLCGFEQRGAENNLLALIPTEFKEYVPPKPGYSKIGCDLCQAECWIGPRQLKEMSDQGLQAVCLRCLNKHLGKDKILAMLGHLGG